MAPFCVAAFAIALIPIGVIQAQNFDGIKKRLAKAVKHDEITLEQAARMMEVLKESARAGRTKTIAMTIG